MTRLLTILLLLVTFSASAVNHYIRDGGSGDGSAWNNAWDDLPATLTRGDTYYIAAGTYGAYVFDDTESSTSVITIKKATVADHGTSTGWDDGYGDGQALFQNTGRVFTFNTGSYTIDGATGSGTNSRGIKLYTSVTTTGDDGVIYTYNDVQPGPNNIQLKSVEICSIGPVTEANEACYVGIYVVHWSTNHYYTNLFIHNVYEWMALTGLSSSIVEHSYFNNAGSDWGDGYNGRNHHAAGITHCSSDFHLRYNVFDSMVGGHNTTFIEPQNIYTDGYYVYGNVFLETFAGASCSQYGVLSMTGSSDVAKNVYIYNNTIYGFNSPCGVSRGGVAGSANFVVQNNVWQNCGSAPTFYNIDVQDNNILNTGQPAFVDAAAGNFRLVTNTVAGVNLGSPYDYDPDGKQRTTWSLGAYEFGTNAPNTNPPIITSGNASGTVSNTFSYVITYTGATATNFGASGLPSGLSRSGSGITGTPTAATTNTVILSVTNDYGYNLKTNIFSISPYVVAPTYNFLGVTNTSASTDPIGANIINGMRCTASNNLVLSNIHVRVVGVTGHYKAAIYNAQYGTLLAQSSGVTNPSSGWVTMPLTSPLSVTNGVTYNLAIWSDASASELYYSERDGTTRAMCFETYTYGDWPSPVALGNCGNIDYSIYADGAPSGPASPTGLSVMNVGTLFKR